MNISSYIELLNYYWKDLVEIFLFSMLFYYFALWLRKDKYKNLLWYFYGYCTFTCFTYYIQLPVLSSFLFIFSPIIILLFIVIHQELLQRNFVALKKYDTTLISKKDWLEQLLRSCLVAINNNVSVTCVIEQTDQLNEFLNAAFLINAQMNNELLNLLIASKSYNEKTIIWLDNVGTIKGINAQWYQSSVTKKQSPMPNWQDEALIYTTKTDAIMFHINPINRMFTLFIHGKQHENISAHHIHNFITKHLAVSKISKNITKGDTYDHIVQKNTEQQRTP